MHSARISIWFFIGALLLVYGLMIFSYGLWTLLTGQTSNVALASLHAPVWWGALMTLLGLFYTLRFRPGKPARKQTGKAQKKEGTPVS